MQRASFSYSRGNNSTTRQMGLKLDLVTTGYNILTEFPLIASFFTVKRTLLLKSRKGILVLVNLLLLLSYLG